MCSVGPHDPGRVLNHLKLEPLILMWTWPPRRSRGVGHDAFAWTGRGELINRALNSVALTITRRRGHRIIVGRLWFQTFQAHPESLRMTAVDPDRRLRRPAQLSRIGPVVHDAEVLIVPAGVGGRPPDNGQIVDGHFEARIVRDLDLRSLWRRRKDLSDEGWRRACNQPSRRSPASEPNSPWISFGTPCKDAPVAPLPYGIGFGVGRGATPQLAAAQGGSGFGVGIRTSFPWVDAEPPILHMPVKVSLLG